MIHFQLKYNPNGSDSQANLSCSTIYDFWLDLLWISTTHWDEFSDTSEKAYGMCIYVKSTDAIDTGRSLNYYAPNWEYLIVVKASNMVNNTKIRTNGRAFYDKTDV